MKEVRINMDNPITDDYLFCAEKGGNEGSLLKTKSQRENNCCPFRRGLNPDKVDQIEANQSRKRRKATSSEPGKEKKRVNSLTDPNPEGSLLSLFCYLVSSAVTFIKRDSVEDFSNI